MDVERALVSWVIQEQSLAEVAEASITPKFFLDTDNRRVFETILDYQSEHGAVPTLRAIRLDEPTYKFMQVDEPISFLIERIRDDHALSIIQAGMEQVVDAYDHADTDAALSYLAMIIADVNNALPSTRDSNVSDTGDDRLAHYLAMRDKDDTLLGAPTGFHALDMATQGLQPEQLVTFVGPPKAGKSTILLLAAIAAWAFGLRPLLFTFEMSIQEMTTRLDSFRARISHHRLQRGALKRSEWDLLEKSINQMSAMPDFWFSADINNATTLSGIAAKVDKIKPDVVYVDGVYLMQDEFGEEQGTPKALTNLTRGFKRMAQNKRIPIAITTQVLEWKMDRKKGITSNSVGYSSSFAQDSDALIGIERTEDPNIQKLKVVLARNSPPMEVYIQWDWETGDFEELESDPFHPEGDGGEWDGEKTTF